MMRWVVGSILNPLSYFSFQPVLHDWCNKGRCMCYPVWCDDAYKTTLAANQERVAYVAAAGFLSRYQSRPLPYV